MRHWRIVIESPEGCFIEARIDGGLVAASGKTAEERRKFLLSEIGSFVEGAQLEVGRKSK